MSRGRKRTPPAESRFVSWGAVCVSVLALPFIVCYLAGWWWGVVFLLPAILYVLYKIYGLLLLLAAWWRWRDSPVVGILVLSDSPIWKDHIDREWITRLSDRVVILNWSERRSWTRSLPVCLFNYFCARQENFNPALILLRGIRHPYVYRYYYAFHDAKHGHPEVLQSLEADMFGRVATSE